ncbi:SusC/RagA family TonB-linked outer membrane protein [Sabulibacter ruber]|uniref:SusC/RagA family TonB-linked outer membrane protein n=1 Tax=Sabulibacter ruber TaxID=2811901 RepID=UPI001A979DBC|nr:TonB-dependent receptor [Sabulibacter ruber]
MNHTAVSTPSLSIVATSTADISISGRIVDEKGDGMPGVTISLKGTTIATSTDATGYYSLSIPEGQQNGTLLVSFIGYTTKEVKIGNQTVLNVTLEPDTKALDEVIVTGYMTQRKADLTGAVSVVTSDVIEKNSYANVLQGLQGRIPGVQITTDGNPVGNAGIQIRGLTSFRSAPPLIVVDGLPTNINLRDINPNDIASIQVLRDAASASIYGSRAASGVILIETKKGKTGETKITYSGQFGVSSFMNQEDMLNTQQYGQAYWQAAVNDGQDPNARTQIFDFDWHRDENGIPVLDRVTPVEWLNAAKTMRSADTDWFKEGTRLGIQNNHQITLTNGTEKSRTLLSLNYYENKGTQIHTYFRRYAVRLNSDYSFLNNRLTIGENLSLSNVNFVDQNHAFSMLTMPPIVPVYTTDGGWGGSAMAMGMDDYNNPIRMLTLGKDNDQNFYKVLGNAYANLRLFKNLNLKTLYGVDYTTGNYRHIDFTWEEGGGKKDENNGVVSNRFHNITTTWTNTLTYGLELGKHKLDILGGIETVRYQFEDLNGYRRDIELEDYDYAYLNAATGTQEVQGGGDEWTLLSYFSKFNYVYNEKYLLSATLRYDGSSKFGRNNRFGFFPAVSAGWRLSEENFLRNNGFLSELKLRASWGRNGNSNIPIGALVDTYDAAYHAGLHGTSYGLGGNETGTLFSGYRKLHTGNPNLKWETTEQTDIGLDFGFFNGALSGSIDFFHKYTYGMLYEPPYLAAIGEGGYRWVNTANMTNRGAEFALSYAGQPTGSFSYSVTGNLSFYRNKINDLPESVKYTFGGNGLDDDILGRPRNSHYGFIADGLFRSQEEVDNSPEQPGKGLGRIRYKDLNNDGRITWEHDRTWLGDSDPDFAYGLEFQAKYKNFDFSMFWQGVVGNTVWNDWKTFSDFWNVHVQKDFNHPVRILDAWSPSNPDSDIPALSMTNPNDELRPSTYFLESGSYLKLRHIELGYNLPQGILSAVRLQNARLYVNAQNIVNLRKWWGDDAYTGIDPESPGASSYVRPQMFFVGVNVSF